MTKTPTPGNAPALSEYLANLQTKAIHLSGVLSAIGHLQNEGHCEDGQIALINVAEQLAKELDSALDCVNLPRGGTVMKADPVRDELIRNVYFGMDAMRLIKELIADVSDHDKLPEGLRETVQAGVENCNYNVALLVEWAEKVE